MPVDSLAYTEMGKKDPKGSLLNRPLVIPQTRQSIPTIKSGISLYHLEDHRMPLFAIFCAASHVQLQKQIGIAS